MTNLSRYIHTSNLFSQIGRFFIWIGDIHSSTYIFIPTVKTRWTFVTQTCKTSNFHLFITFVDRYLLSIKGWHLKILFTFRTLNMKGRHFLKTPRSLGPHFLSQTRLDVLHRLTSTRRTVGSVHRKGRNRQERKEWTGRGFKEHQKRGLGVL